jgi:hypothetical protein
LNNKRRHKVLHRMTASIPWLQSVRNFFLNRILRHDHLQGVFWKPNIVPAVLVKKITYRWFWRPIWRYTKQDSSKTHFIVILSSVTWRRLVL